MDTNKKKKIKNLTLIIGGSVLMVIGGLILIVGIYGGYDTIHTYNINLESMTIDKAGVTLKILPYYAFMILSGSIMFTSSFFVFSKIAVKNNNSV